MSPPTLVGLRGPQTLSEDRKAGTLLSSRCPPVRTSLAAVDAQGSREAEPLRAASDRGCGGGQGQVLRVPGEAEPLHRGRGHRMPEGVGEKSRGTHSLWSCGLRVTHPGSTDREGGGTWSFDSSPRGAAGCREPHEPSDGQDQDPQSGLGTLGSPCGSAGAGDGVRAPSSGTAGAGDGAEMLGGDGKGTGRGWRRGWRGDKGAGRGL